MSQRLVRVLAGLAITLFFAGHAARLFPVGLIDRLDNFIYDARLRLTMPGKGDARIVILDVDEKSLNEFGRWPWNRDLMARLMDKLFVRYGVAAVAFDMVWAERDASSGIDVLDDFARHALKDAAGFQSAYRQLRGRLDYDALFAASMKGRPVVLGYYFSNENAAVRTNAIPGPVLPQGAFAGRYAPVTRWSGYTGNLPGYLANAAGAGHMNPIVDVDGEVRRVPLLAEFDGAYYEAFSLAVLRTWLAATSGAPVPPAVEVRSAPGGEKLLEWLEVGGLRIPVDEQAVALVPYAGRKFSFAYLSLADVLNDRVPPGQLKGKLVLVGSTAPGLLDHRSTPVDSVFPGVEIHANLVAGMINRSLKSEPAYGLVANPLLILAAGIALSLLLPALSPLWATLATAAGIALLGVLNLVAWTRGDAVLPLAAAVLMASLVYVVNMAHGYFVETRSKRRFAELFGQYVPPELVDQMAADPDRYSMQPKAAELTILFADVRGFTGISETLRPEELREYIDAFLTAMSGIIREKYRGTLDKYIGDAVMAFWGAPVEDPRHARNGVLAALQMQKECEVLNERFAARGWPPLRIGVGVNTGIVRVGDMGSRVRRAYTVLGDAVNIASRLESRTRHYGVGILAGEATRNAVPDIVFREVDRIRVKGKEAAISVHEPIGLAADLSPELRAELGLWDRALSAYRLQAWGEADASLRMLMQVRRGFELYAVFSAKVADLRRNPPPPDWDGVTAFDEK